MPFSFVSTLNPSPSRSRINGSALLVEALPVFDFESATNFLMIFFVSISEVFSIYFPNVSVGSIFTSF